MYLKSVSIYKCLSSISNEINEMEKVNLILNRLHFSEQFYVFSIPFQIRLAFNVCRLNCCVKSRYIFFCNFNSFLYWRHMQIWDYKYIRWKYWISAEKYLLNLVNCLEISRCSRLMQISNFIPIELKFMK